jgi:hypothetical protein
MESPIVRARTVVADRSATTGLGDADAAGAVFGTHAANDARKKASSRCTGAHIISVS